MNREFGYNSSEEYFCYKNCFQTKILLNRFLIKLFSLYLRLSPTMIGAAGSRHLRARRGSSPGIQASDLPVRRLSTRIEEEPEEADKSSGSKEDDKDSPKSQKTDSTRSATPPPRSAPQRSATSATTTPSATRRQSIVPNGTRTATRLSITELPAGARLRQRRRAVEITDQRTCVLLHSRLKGMKLEDIA